MPVALSATGVKRAVTESVAGLPRQFWWLWTSTLVNRLGAFVATFMVLYLTVERGYSASYAGLVASLYGFGGVIASLGGGVLSDRIGRRPTMLLAQCGTAGTVALLAFVQDPVAIAAVAFCVGTASSTSRPAVQAMMADIVRPEDRVRAFSLNYWAINLGFAVSSTAAGFVAQYSYRAGFLAEAVMTLLCAIVVWAKVPESRPRSAPAPADRHERAEPPADSVSMVTVLRDGRFMTVVTLSFVVALVFQQGWMALPVAMGRAGFSTSDFGLVIGANGLLIVLLQIPASRFMERREPRSLLILSSVLAGYGFGVTAFAGSLGLYLVSVLVWTIAEIVNAPTQTSLVVRLSPAQGRGRYQGMYSMSWSVAALVAPLMSGAVLDHLGADWLWGTCAVLGTVAGFGYWLLMRGLPESDLAPAEAPAVPAAAPAVSLVQADAGAGGVGAPAAVEALGGGTGEPSPR